MFFYVVELFLLPHSLSGVCDVNKVIHVFNTSLDNIIAVHD